MSVKLRIKNNVLTLLICFFISLIIYFFAVIENTYQSLIEGKADAYSIALIVFFVGLIIFLISKISPLFGKFIFKMFGAEEELKSEPR